MYYLDEKYAQTAAEEARRRLREADEQELPVREWMTRAKVLIYALAAVDRASRRLPT
jgi:hypothetical protein